MIEDGTASLTRATMSSGSAVRGASVAIVDGILNASNALMANAENAEAGGAIYQDGGTLDLRFSTIYGTQQLLSGLAGRRGGVA